MNQSLDPVEWPSICFEGELLPQSAGGISILINRNFTERTGDWIWRFPHCKEVWKGGDAEWCITSATEIIDHLLEYRSEVANEIRDRLGPHGFDADLTMQEWLTALARVQSLAKSCGDNCRWIAGEATEIEVRGLAVGCRHSSIAKPLLNNEQAQQVVAPDG